MVEKQLLRQQENNKSLSKAVGDIVFLMERSGMCNRGGARDKLWQKKAIENPEYTDKINELHNALEEVDRKKKEFPEIIDYAQFFFGHVEKGQTKDFLIDVWWSRITPSDDLDKIMDIGIKEAHDMFEEMGIKSSLCNEPVKKILFEKVISSFLQNKLKLKFQPTSQPKPHQNPPFGCGR